MAGLTLSRASLLEAQNAGVLHQSRHRDTGRTLPFQATTASSRRACENVVRTRSMPMQLRSRNQRAVECLSAAPTTSQAEGTADTGVEETVSLLKRAAATRAVPAAQVTQALLGLEKMKKLPSDHFGNALGGAPGGKGWRLTFLIRAKQVTEAQKGGKASGSYVPIPAVQRWDAEKGEISNGIYLGQIAAMALEGPYEIKGKKLSFDFNKLKIRLGPKWIPFNIPSSVPKDGKPGPFFLFFYADEEICLARGRGGGIAMWARTTPSWELKAGVSL